MNSPAKILREYIEVVNEMNDLNEINAVDKMSQQEAGYIPQTSGPNKCVKCSHFLEPNACELVEGPISPLGWCDYFDPASVTEKWGTETKVSPSEKGKYKGRTLADLRKSYNALKKSGPHKRGSPEFGRMRELAFAIRAKTGWGSV